ncbi:hypothetical protein JI58_04345 [Marinosulfonomonas sp. PRT-SC04]|nr:hypothetical protein JI58_04345 [Marinosulfonomonas sp. PRT-SC04]
MPHYEYKVVPAPKKGLKIKGVKTVEARFSHAMMDILNELGAEGWEYQRSDTLPCEERSGLRGRSITVQNMLVFRRAITTQSEVVQAVTAPVTAPVTAAPIVAAKPVTEAAATPTTVAAEIAPDVTPGVRAPLLNAARNDGHRAAPTLGPATGAVEVKDPRTHR